MTHPSVSISASPLRIRGFILATVFHRGRSFEQFVNGEGINDPALHLNDQITCAIMESEEPFDQLPNHWAICTEIGKRLGQSWQTISREAIKCRDDVWRTRVLAGEICYHKQLSSDEAYKFQGYISETYVLPATSQSVSPATAARPKAIMPRNAQEMAEIYYCWKHFKKQYR
jgi:hypothetical protein